MADSQHSGPYLAAEGETWVLKADYDALELSHATAIAQRDRYRSAHARLEEQLEAAQTALAPFAKAGKKLIHQGSQGYRNGTYDDQTETYTFRVGDVIAAYKIAGTSDPGDAPQSSAPQSDEPSGARGAPFPATNASEPVEATQGPSTDGNPSSHPGSEASVPASVPTGTGSTTEISGVYVEV